MLLQLFGRLWVNLLIHFGLEKSSFSCHFGEWQRLVGVSPMTENLLFLSSWTFKTLRLGWNCLSLLISLTTVLKLESTSLSIIGVLFLYEEGFELAEVSVELTELGPSAFRFLLYLPPVTMVKPSLSVDAISSK